MLKTAKKSHERAKMGYDFSDVATVCSPQPPEIGRKSYTLRFQ
jgi:hypothetical protein